MPLALLISSHVAASTVGGGASAPVLNAAGIDSMLVPTVLYGRHPGWGAPGGGAVASGLVQSMLDAIEAQGLYAGIDLVLTGYFADPAQVFAAAAAIDAVRAARRDEAGANEPDRIQQDRPWIVIDPVLGDAPDGLYVAPPIALAIRDQLLPRADLVTPNAFELGYLTGRPLTDLGSMLRAARALECPALVTSLPRRGRIGVMYCDGDEAWMVTHERCPHAPKGTGDVLTAEFAAARLGGLAPKPALERAVAATVSLVMRANELGSRELPLVAEIAARRDPLVTLEAEAL
ncbi:bifunctional hydroxymethylpyrimidine kinase/phosphomethylpyrimidine kinase [Maricaulis sp.]|uniref:bifunctional hydroxymethylpyrimidine kinase/phosphomethylpyrimidine kinase n=1 Tax=Maricaulis sp. TaxID=1486257 RepID=UPI003A8D7CE4